MNRSKWKGPFIKQDILALTKKDLYVKTFSKNSVITPKILGKIFDVYNGNMFHKLIIKEEMIGYKLGEFLFTRKKFSFKKKTKKKDDKKNK